MNYQQTIKIFGRISYQLASAMGMHAVNMERQSRGELIAYSEKQFENICAVIKEMIDEL